MSAWWKEWAERIAVVLAEHWTRSRGEPGREPVEPVATPDPLRPRTDSFGRADDERPEDEIGE